MSQWTNKKYGNPMKNSNKGKDERVLPIKSPIKRLRFKRYWMNHSRFGMRNWMIFRMGIVTGLRASDLVRLKYSQVYNVDKDLPRTHIINERDKKTGKANQYLDIKPLEGDLTMYDTWLRDIIDHPKYMFPKSTNLNQPISAHYLYVIMSRTAGRLGMTHIGSHSLRKTCGYIAYTQTKNIVYVMKKLNQSNPAVTLRYIDCDRANMDQITDSIDW